MPTCQVRPGRGRAGSVLKLFNVHVRCFVTMSRTNLSFVQDQKVNKNCIVAEDCVWGSLSIWASDSDVVGTDMEVADFEPNSFRFHETDETRDFQDNAVIPSNCVAHLDSSEPRVASAASQVIEWNKIAEKELLSANVDGARNALNFALKLIENKSANHPLLTAMTFTNLGSLHCQMRSFEEALRCFEKVVACSDGYHLNALMHLKFCTAYSGRILSFGIILAIRLFLVFVCDNFYRTRQVLDCMNALSPPRSARPPFSQNNCDLTT